MARLRPAYLVYASDAGTISRGKRITAAQPTRNAAAGLRTLGAGSAGEDGFALSPVREPHSRLLPGLHVLPSAIVKKV